MNEKALVTLAVGAEYGRIFDRLCRGNWQSYAARHGYDLVVLTRPLDESPRARARSPAWQKCLILEQPEVRSYRQVVWLDSDILINAEAAPCVCAGVPEDRVGGVDAYAGPTPELYRAMLERLYAGWRAQGVRFVDNLTAAQFYANRRLPPLDRVVQTGVLVASPARHAALFRRVYDDYEELGSAEWNYEMGFLSWELVRADVVTWLDHRFNLLVGDEISQHYGFLNANIFAPLLGPAQAPAAAVLHRHLMKHCLQAMFRNAFFLHVTGMQNLIDRTEAMAAVLES